MSTPDWGRIEFADGVLPERVAGDAGLVVWVPDGLDGPDRAWLRVVVSPRAEARPEGGLTALPATAFRARRRTRGFVDRLIRRLRGEPDDREWAIPGGGLAERRGGRRNDLIVVWAEDAAGDLVKDRIRARWPAACEQRRIGRGLFLVNGIAPPGEGAPAAPREGSPREEAERLLDRARLAADRPGEAAALADLGFLLTRAGEHEKAATALEGALELYRHLGEGAREADTLLHLGELIEARGDFETARQLWSRAVERARAAGDRVAETRARERLAQAHFRAGDHVGALVLFGAAATLAGEIGDRAREARLLWSAGLAHAELGQHGPAEAAARRAVDVLTALGDPRAGWYADHLLSYRAGRAGAPIEAPSSPVPPAPAAAAAPLRMAVSGAASLAKFVGSGLRTVPAEARKSRLAACRACEHDTGLRCRVCGCFTAAKSRLPHEDCPLGRWPAPGTTTGA